MSASESLKLKIALLLGFFAIASLAGPVFTMIVTLLWVGLTISRKKFGWDEEKKLTIFFSILAFLLIQQSVLIPLISPRIEITDEKTNILVISASGPLPIAVSSNSKNINPQEVGFLYQSFKLNIYPPLIQLSNEVYLNYDSKVELLNENPNPFVELSAKGNQLVVKIKKNTWSLGLIQTTVNTIRQYLPNELVNYAVRIPVKTEDTNVIASWIGQNINEYPIFWSSSIISFPSDKFRDSANRMSNEKCICFFGNDNYKVWPSFQGEENQCYHKEDLLTQFEDPEISFFVTGRSESSSQYTIPVTMSQIDKPAIAGINQTCS